MRQIKLGDRIITADSAPYLIAEIGHNHMGSVDTCKELIYQAWKAGADAVKLQKRCNEKLFTRDLFNQPYENKNSYGDTYGLHRQALEFNKDQYIELIEYAKCHRITLFATPFDKPSLDMLAELNMPFYKIQSADCTNLYFINQICNNGKPIILSTGGASEVAIENAVTLINQKGNPLAILHCVARYPARAKEINLNIIPHLQGKYSEEIIGFSSHYDGILASVGAYLMGAQIIEQHFTLSHTNKGTDHALSLQPAGLKKLSHYLAEIYKMKGENKRTKEQELMERDAIEKLGKSMYFNRDMALDEVIRWKDIDIKSPMSPYGMKISQMFLHGPYITNRQYKAGDLMLFDNLQQ